MQTGNAIAIFVKCKLEMQLQIENLFETCMRLCNLPLCCNTCVPITLLDGCLTICSNPCGGVDSKVNVCKIKLRARFADRPYMIF